MKNIEKELLELQDKKYKDFQSKLVPNIDSNNIIGIRTPELRNYAKKLFKSNDFESFLEELPHHYYEENLLHFFVISMIKDFDECVKRVIEFLPYVDCWPVCDQASPKCFSKNHDSLLPYIKNWLKSKETYTIRFGIRMLMNEYLDKDYKPEYLELVSKVKSEEYYVNMMKAWFFATALAKQYTSTLPYIENNKLDTWTHNKTIQKAVESYRIIEEQKEYLKSLKRK